VVTPLVDSFGRRHRDLRISVTDRCNFRCTYCMPEEGMQWLPREEILTFEEIHRIAALMVDRYGIDSIRLTGGEPTVRAHLPLLVQKLATLGVDLAMTTNGASLDRHAAELKAAGLRRINISLDTLRADRFEELTRRNELGAVLAGIDAAVAAGFDPVKINAVVMAGVNEDEIVDLATFGRERGVHVRFIEFMPLDADGGWARQQVVSQAEILERIGAVHPVEPVGRTGEPAQRFRYVDGAGEFGVIPSVTAAFCDQCDRVRLTAEGQLRNCLFALDEFDLRRPLRDGADDAELAAVIERCVGAKWAGHQIGQVTFVKPPKSMSQIGG
jgi:cyclic pyranopterin phosphate synthase